MNKYASESRLGGLTGLLFLAAPVTATAAFWLFIVVARKFHFGSASGGYVALAVSISLGMIFIWRTPFRLPLRLTLCAVFAVLAASWLVIFGLGFVCLGYGDCL